MTLRSLQEEKGAAAQARAAFPGGSSAAGRDEAAGRVSGRLLRSRAGRGRGPAYQLLAPLPGAARAPVAPRAATETRLPHPWRAGPGAPRPRPQRPAAPPHSGPRLRRAPCECATRGGFSSRACPSSGAVARGGRRHVPHRGLGAQDGSGGAEAEDAPRRPHLCPQLPHLRRAVADHSFYPEEAGQYMNT